MALTDLFRVVPMDSRRGFSFENGPAGPSTYDCLMVFAGTCHGTLCRKPRDSHDRKMSRKITYTLDCLQLVQVGMGLAGLGVIKH